MRKSFPRINALVGVLAPACMFFVGTACGAEDATVNTTSTVQQGQSSASVELQNADSRVDQAKIKLDYAHKQLNAAKAALKAAEAEFKAARADRDAIALRETATALASSSGFSATTPAEPIRQVILPPNGGNRLTPVTTQQSALQPAVKQQALDFNAQPADLAPVPASAPQPAASEPTYVP